MLKKVVCKKKEEFIFDEHKYIRLRDALHYMGLSREQFYSMRRKYPLQHEFKDGVNVVYSIEKLNTWLTEHFEVEEE